MDRRSFLSASSIAAITSLAGCFGRDETDAAPADNDSSPTYKPEPVTTDAREWHGGYRRTEEHGAVIYADGLHVSAVFAYASPQLGVYFGDPVDGNTEDIPDEEFDWVVASDGAYLWTPYIELRSEASDYYMEPENPAETVPPDRWIADGGETTDSREVQPLATGFDESPTYYRLVDRDGTRTMLAYTYPEQQGRDGRFPAFEVASRWCNVTYDGDDARAKWTFDF